MKKKLLTAVAVLASLCGYAQTKGTSTLGLGVNVSTNKTEFNDQSSSDSKTKQSSFSLGYGLFIKDNTRIGIELQYGKGSGNSTDTKSYGGNVTYQQYYPLIGKLYAYAGGKAGYGYATQKFENTESYSGSNKTNQYSLGAYGGLTWFVSKRFAFETTLLSANANYLNYNQKVNGATVTENKQTNFNLTTQGFIDDLGFKIYLLF
ncbi:outer membrane beta-barrel protein [Pedobacter sp. V48]|uniref:outer membrane beta-barrel protein n=1 Tax=Pedobacter sp. V48 TaxID=509635 RepID=UPI0003E52C3B|nr:outer membrane beta-barrel protein [Pedobacter sp. V48]ETZ21489.1 hypothetical protein N824_28905 [Pedobacter sp. V48]